MSNLNLNDGARVNSDFGPIEFDVSDSFSSVSSLSLSISDNDGDQVYDSSLDCSEDSCEKSVEFPVSELSSGNEYTLDVYREDSEGNSDSKTLTFTYDDRYEGDTNPEVRPEPGVFDGGGPGTFDIVLDGSDDEDSDVSVVCSSDEWGKIDETGSEYLSDGDSEEFTCEYTRFDIDRKMDLDVKLMDEAGNEETVSVGEYLFDYNSPVLGNLSSVVGIYNDDFNVSYDAYDNRNIEGLRVSKIHYQVDDQILDLQEGSDISELDGEFGVNTSGLSAGKHTVYAWAVDRVGHVSERESFTFDFRPNSEPEASLSSVSKLNVTAGKSESVSVNVTNTGELFIGKMDLKMGSDLGNRSRVIEGLKPTESEDALFSLDTDSSDLGVHTLDFMTESPDSSKTVRVVVTANSEQEEKIKSDYQEYLEKYNELEENVTSLKDKGIADYRAEKLDGNTSEFFSDMQAAKSAMNDGDLYKVENQLKDIKSDYEQASSSYDEVREAHATAERNELVGMILFFFVALGGSGMAYVTYFSEEYALDAEALVDRAELLEEPVQTVQTTLDQYEVSLAPVENAVEKVAELIAEEEEEIEEAEGQAFQGFT